MFRIWYLGRECKEALNECMDHSLNDCDPIATCQDQQEGYTCTCPIGAKDISPNPSKPGRKCLIVSIIRRTGSMCFRIIF